MQSVTFVYRRATLRTAIGINESGEDFPKTRQQLAAHKSVTEIQARRASEWVSAVYLPDASCLDRSRLCPLIAWRHRTREPRGGSGGFCDLTGG